MSVWSMSVRRWYGSAIWACCFCVVTSLEHPICRTIGCNYEDDNGVNTDVSNYIVDGENLRVEMTARTFSLTCEGNMTLDNPHLPRLNTLTYFTTVTLNNCSPRHYSYADALSVLNVSVAAKLFVNGADDVLTSENFAGLDIENLIFNNMSLAADAFKDMPKLKRLHLDHMSPPPINSLPNTLLELHIIRSGIQLQENVYINLTNLEKLLIREDNVNVSVKATAPLNDVSLIGQFVFLNAELPNTLKSVFLNTWGEVVPVPWKTCNINSLTVVKGSVKTLPNNWLANCTALRVLKLNHMRALSLLEPRAFHGAFALENVSLKCCNLQELPGALLSNARKLRFLDLSGNALHILRSDLFLQTRVLVELNLANNNLTSEVFRSVSSVTSLQVLNLSNNKHLGDANGFDGLPWGLDNLSKLLLHNTSAQFISPNWRYHMPSLTYLDLSENLITCLSYPDLQFRTNVTVILKNNNVTKLTYDSNNYLNHSHCKIGKDDASASRVFIKLHATLNCSCDEAWTALALRTCPAHIDLEGARCTGGEDLASVQLDQLTCATKPNYCPLQCDCKQFLRTEKPMTVIRVKCEQANLTELPKLPRDDDVAWELHLAYNNISEPNAQYLPKHVIVLDLRNNFIRKVDVVISLLPKALLVNLSGNQLDCVCGTEQALAELNARAALVGDFHELKCSNGATLIVTAYCGLGITMALVLTPLLLVTCFMIICLVRSKSRKRGPKTLSDIGLLPRPSKHDNVQVYDVFLSFSNNDVHVVKKIKAWLEHGTQPYRTLTHENWMPGGYIPEQISESVRRSRQTVTIVSEHFLQSKWAIAEFYTAYSNAMCAGESRLIVILLQDPADLPLNRLPENNYMRSYIINNTCLLWSDPLFEQKFRASLSPPRGCAQSDSKEVMLMKPLSNAKTICDGAGEPRSGGGSKGGRRGSVTL